MSLFTEIIMTQRLVKFQVSLGSFGNVTFDLLYENRVLHPHEMPIGMLKTQEQEG